jgi:hypothetical protein
MKRNKDANLPKIVRYQDEYGKIHYGSVDDDTISQLSSGFAEIAEGLSFTAVWLLSYYRERLRVV